MLAFQRERISSEKRVKKHVWMDHEEGGGIIFEMHEAIHHILVSALGLSGPAGQQVNSEQVGHSPGRSYLTRR